MDIHQGMILIGGTGRNIGKTTLAESLIRKLSRFVPVTAIKMANIHPRNFSAHGHDVRSFRHKISIRKETDSQGNKDSMRFLKAGAVDSWFIETKDEFLSETFPEIEKILKKTRWSVCESNSLRNFIRPALFIMVRGDAEPPAQKNVPGLLLKADAVVRALDWNQFDNLVERIVLGEGRFELLR